MSISLFLCKGDVDRCVRRNPLKFAIAAVIAAVAVIVAVRNAVTIDGLADCFEGKANALYAFMRGDGSMFTYVLASLVEYAAMLALVVLSSYGNATMYLSYAAIAYKGYTCAFDVTVVLRYYVVRAALFAALYLALSLAILCALAGYIVFAINSQCRYRYGVREIKTLVYASVPYYIAFAALFLIQLIVVGIGCAVI